MAIVECNECKGQVSDSAPACPHCGAPFKKFMGPPKGFKDRFSEARLNAAEAEAKAKKREAGGGCLRVLVGAAALVFLVLVVLAIL